MTNAIIKTAFTSGELAPSLWGATDYVKFPQAASTMRNMFVNYRMGASSKAGTKFVGQCLAPGSGLPPRPITFQFNVNVSYILEFGDRTMRIVYRGGYVTEDAKPITAATQANPGRLTVPANGYSNLDWVAAASVTGMTELNGRTFIVANVTTDTFTLQDTFGTAVNTQDYDAYVSGGTVARIYTIVSPYAIEDLPYLKFTQSADVMSLTCTNTVTGTEYPAYDLVRSGTTDWAFVQTTFTAEIAAPGGVPTAVATPATGTTTYNYVITAIDAQTGEESVASGLAIVTNAVNLATTAGSILVTWLPVTGAGAYNVYKAPAGVEGGTVPIGSSFGIAGNVRGTQWTDDNVVPDYSRTPPLHLNPFARGRIIGAAAVAGGSSYVQATTTVTVTTSTGSGVVIKPVVVSGAVVAYIVENEGEGYVSTDTLVVTGAGSGATGSISVGPQTGTYPGVVAYNEQRRTYAARLNAPDTYNMSRPGLYQNFDTADPPVDSDAIEGTPWGQQVNGIQWMLPVTNGLLCMTGLGIWIVSGQGGGPITPSSQSAEPQEYNGIAATVGPLRIKQNVLYVQDKGSLVNDLEFNFYNNTFTGSDISVISNHLFQGYEIVQWAWAQEPWKIAWVVRDDGRALSLTYVKDQKIAGWGRHDTNGLYKGVAVASERPVDAPYFVVRRYVPGKLAWAYYMERMDNRNWPNAEEVWAVDCGLALPRNTPAAVLSADVSTGTNVAFTASTGVFNGTTIGVVGQVIRMGGGKATVTEYVSPTVVRADITVSITNLIPNNPDERPIPAIAGAWSITTPQSEVGGLDHLEGFTVIGLADGAEIPPQVVTDGTITLPIEASAVVVGLPYVCQLQTMHADVPGHQPIQGDRKRIYSANYRTEMSRGVEVGTNQPNASAQQNQADVTWGQGNQFVGKMIEQQPVQNLLNQYDYLPLFTGDLNMNLDGDFDLTGMVAFQQTKALPMNILMVQSAIELGDTDSQ